ncbi:MAG: dienelactone hydrolase family protein [Nitrospiraceae bacterium]
MSLVANLDVPAEARGVVLFAHGSGSSRFSPRNRLVAHALRSRGFATLLADLLTSAEETVDAVTGQHRFNIGLLAERLIGLTDWLVKASATQGLPIGYFGASTGAGAALIAAAERAQVVRAIVSRGGRPDLAGPSLRRVQAPTLLIIGGDDLPVIGMNREAFAQLTGEKKLEIVSGASHLFEEPGALQTVTGLACDWFASYLSHKT